MLVSASQITFNGKHLPPNTHQTSLPHINHFHELTPPSSAEIRSEHEECFQTPELFLSHYTTTPHWSLFPKPQNKQWTVLHSHKQRTITKTQECAQMADRQTNKRHWQTDRQKRDRLTWQENRQPVEPVCDHSLGSQQEFLYC